MRPSAASWPPWYFQPPGSGPPKVDTSGCEFLTHVPTFAKFWRARNLDLGEKLPACGQRRDLLGRRVDSEDRVRVARERNAEAAGVAVPHHFRRHLNSADAFKHTENIPPKNNISP